MSGCKGILISTSMTIWYVGVYFLYQPAGSLAIAMQSNLKPSIPNGHIDCVIICKGHSIRCSTSKQICADCKHNTTGPHCNLCKDGFYGNATVGKIDDCKKCPCPFSRSNGTCYMNASGIAVCANCSKNYNGPRCSNCDVGYYKDLKDGSCVKCDCNGFGNTSVTPQVCNPQNGVCYQCLNNTSGKHCDTCKDGYYWTGLTSDDRCVPCNCHGNEDKDSSIICDSNTGVCFSCINNTVGNHCEKCAFGYTGDAIQGKNCTKVLNDKPELKSRNIVVPVITSLSITLITLISVAVICFWRRKKRGDSAQFVTVRMNTGSDELIDVSHIDPVTGDPIQTLDDYEDDNIIEIPNGNLQFRSLEFDVLAEESRDTDRML